MQTPQNVGGSAFSDIFFSVENLLKSFFDITTDKELSVNSLLRHN